MKYAIATTSCLALVLAACSHDPLAAAKKRVKETYQKEDASLLVPLNATSWSLPAAAGPTDRIEVEGGAITLPKWDSIKDAKHGREATIGFVSAYVVTKAYKPTYSSLPSSWGADDLEKIIFICRTSAHDIDAATSKEQLEEAVVRLAAKSTMTPLQAHKGLSTINASTFSGLMSGSIEANGVELIFRPKTGQETYYKIIFKGGGKASTKDLEPVIAAMEFAPSP